MAQFRGVVEGKSRTEASRLGSKDSGLFVQANGWEAGVEVEVYHDEHANKDVFKVYATAGSNERQGRRYLGEVHSGDDGPQWFPCPI